MLSFFRELDLFMFHVPSVAFPVVQSRRKALLLNSVQEGLSRATIWEL